MPAPPFGSAELGLLFSNFFQFEETMVKKAPSAAQFASLRGVDWEQIEKNLEARLA